MRLIKPALAPVVAAILMSCALGSTFAFAQSASVVKDIDDVQADTLRYQALAANADARANLKAKGGVSGADSSDALPNVKAVKLFGSELYAYLIYKDGQEQPGKVGEKMPGCLTISKIEKSQVEVIDCEHKTHILAMSGMPPVNTEHSSGQPTTAMPIGSPMPMRPMGH